MAQYAIRRFVEVEPFGAERRQRRRDMRDLARHLRRLAEQHVHFHIDRRVLEMSVGHTQAAFPGRLADHGERAAFALAQRAEQVQAGRCNGQHIAFLRFVAPDFARRHAGFKTEHIAQFEFRAEAGAMREFRHGIGQAAGTDVMHREDRIALAHRPAAVDDFLGATLDFRVAALHGIEIQRFHIAAGAHAGCRTAAQADEQTGAAELDQQRAGLEGLLVDMAFLHVADTAGQHDRLVITAHLAIRRAHLEAAEIAGQIRAAEFVVECGRADRPVEHDLQRRNDAARFAVFRFPGLLEAGNAQIGNSETGQAGLGLGTLADRTLVADLAA